MRVPSWRRPLVMTAFLAGILCILIAGWFYASLRLDYGRITAFNRKPLAQLSEANHPPEFYYALSPAQIFSTPIRPFIPNRMIPIFYSETWGDYWGFFYVFGWSPEEQQYTPWRTLKRYGEGRPLPPNWETNLPEAASYLGRVNAVSLFPTCLILVFLGAAVVQVFFRRTISPDTRQRIQAFELLLISLFVTIAGYLWFLAQYPNAGTGDTVKATYVLHAFPWLALFFGDTMTRMGERWPRCTMILVMLLTLVWLHNFPAMLTHNPVR